MKELIHQHLLSSDPHITNLRKPQKQVISYQCYYFLIRTKSNDLKLYSLLYDRINQGAIKSFISHSIYLTIILHILKQYGQVSNEFHVCVAVNIV